MQVAALTGGDAVKLNEFSIPSAQLPLTVSFVFNIRLHDVPTTSDGTANTQARVISVDGGTTSSTVRFGYHRSNHVYFPDKSWTLNYEKQGEGLLIKPIPTWTITLTGLATTYDTENPLVVVNHLEQFILSRLAVGSRIAWSHEMIDDAGNWTPIPDFDPPLRGIDRNLDMASDDESN